MPVVTNVVEIITQQTLTESSLTKNVWNVYHYRLVAGSMDSRTAIANAFDAAVLTFVLNQQSADISGVATLCRLLDDASEQYSTVANAVPGQIALPRLPGDLAIVLPLRCAQRGKQFRGRKSFRGVPTASVVKDELTAGAAAAWATIAAKILAVLVGTTGNYQPCVVSRTLSQLKTNPTTIVASDVTSVLVNKTIGTFRRSKEKTIR